MEPLSSDKLGQSNQYFPESGKTSIAHTRTCRSGSSPEDEVTGVVGDTARLGGGPTLMAAGEGVATGLGVYRGEGADGDGRYISTIEPDAITPVSGSTKESPVAASAEQSWNSQTWGPENASW